MSKSRLSEIRAKAETYLLRAGLKYRHIQILERYGYFEKPASLHHHFAHKGGLMEHSINVTNWMLRLKISMGCDLLGSRSICRIGMLHDLCKCLCYEYDKKTKAFVWSQPTLTGHGSASVIMAGVDLGLALAPEEALAIAWHMGAFGLGKDDLARYDAALKAYPREILLAHTADMMASHVTECEVQG